MKSEMKQLFFFVILLAVLGIASFMYRSALEAPTHNTNTTNTTCPVDTKTCPDGSSIGRTGPSCQFALCELPNVEVPQAGISFVIPGGYRVDTSSKAGEPSVVGAYVNDTIVGSSTSPTSIIVRDYQIPEGTDANQVMLGHTVYETSGLSPKSMTEFSPVLINGKTFQMIVVERFEGTIHLAYYLPQDTTVVRFDVIVRNVQNWTDQNLSVRSLAGVTDLETLLSHVTTN